MLLLLPSLLGTVGLGICVSVVSVLSRIYSPYYVVHVWPGGHMETDFVAL